MAVHDNREFEQLFAAYSNGELTKAECSRLYDLAGQDVGRRGALAEMEAVHELLKVEVRMRKTVQRPAEPAEEADESYRRLAAAAARAQAKLRANLEQATMIQTMPLGDIQKRSAVRTWGMVLAAAALVVVSVLVGMGMGQTSGLDGSNPDNKVLGYSISMRTVLTVDDPRFSWDPVEDATRYDASILDHSGTEVVLRPTVDIRVRRATEWTLSSAGLEVLRKHGELFLRVVATDKRGEVLARSTSKTPIELR